jgi:hypothetical protein
VPYREKRIYSGDQLEVEGYPITLRQRKQKRKVKEKESSKAQKNLNDKNARKHLSRKINCNFIEKKDVVAHLTYVDKYLPKTAEEAKKDVVNYIRRVKHYRKKLGLTELKYIAVIEFKESGEKEKGIRMHHHVIMSGDVERDILEELWGKGYANVDRLKADEYGFEALSRYVLKDPKGCKRWIQSRNLKEPVVKVNDFKLSKKKVIEMAKNVEDRSIFEKLYPGYILNHCEAAFNNENGQWYLYIRMRKFKEKYKR